MNFLGLFRRSSRKSISPDVKLGRNVKVYDFVNLYGCEIGDESQIGTFVEIQRGARVGRRVKVSSHTFICEGVEVGDDVFIGHGVMFINDKYPRAVNPTASPSRAPTGKWCPPSSAAAPRSDRTPRFSAASRSAKARLSALAAWSPTMCRRERSSPETRRGCAARSRGTRDRERVLIMGAALV